MDSNNGPYMKGSGLAQHTGILSGASQDQETQDQTLQCFLDEFDVGFQNTDEFDFASLNFDMNFGVPNGGQPPGLVVSPSALLPTENSQELDVQPNSHPPVTPTFAIPPTAPAYAVPPTTPTYPIAPPATAYPGSRQGPEQPSTSATSSYYPDPSNVFSPRRPYPLQHNHHHQQHQQYQHQHQQSPQHPVAMYPQRPYSQYGQQPGQPANFMPGMYPPPPPGYGVGYLPTNPASFPVPMQPPPTPHKRRPLSQQQLVPHMPPPPNPLMNPHMGRSARRGIDSTLQSQGNATGRLQGKVRQLSSNSSGSSSALGNSTRVSNNRKLKKKGDPKTNPAYYYTKTIPKPDSWGSKQRIKYTEHGQWEEGLLFTADQLRRYLEECPRPVKIWVQNTPAQCNNRLDTKDRKCRWRECPVATHSIHAGWHRVVFDEYAHETSCGDKDPFKVAGAMHLWCFERCFDPVEFYDSGRLSPDRREFPREAKNPMALTRDNNKNIIHGAFRRWFREHQEDGRITGPREPHSKTLAYALVKYHIDNQTSGRQNTRKKRNQNKPVSEQKTMDIHMGDLALFAARNQPATKKYLSTIAEQENQHLPATDYNAQGFDALSSAIVAPPEPQPQALEPALPSPEVRDRIPSEVFSCIDVAPFSAALVDTQAPTYAVSNGDAVPYTPFPVAPADVQVPDQTPSMMLPIPSPVPEETGSCIEAKAPSPTSRKRSRDEDEESFGSLFTESSSPQSLSQPLKRRRLSSTASALVFPTPEPESNASETG